MSAPPSAGCSLFMAASRGHASPAHRLAGRLGFPAALAEWDPRGEVALLTSLAPRDLSLSGLRLRAAPRFHFRQAIAKIHEKAKTGTAGTGGAFVVPLGCLAHVSIEP